MTTKIKFLAPLAAVSALAASAAPAVAGTVTASNGPVRATLHAGTHHPRVNHHWSIQVTATVNGRPARAGAYYQFLYQNKDVSNQAVCPNAGVTNCKNWGFKFTGSYSDFLLFPPQSINFPLTVRVVVSVGSRKVYLPYSVSAIR